MRIVAFDLETIANPAMIEFLPAVEPRGGLKDPEKIKADIEEKTLRQREEMGLDKWFSLICCASFKDLESGDIVSFSLAENMDENKLLTEIWDHLHQYTRFVSFNGIEFDVPVLIAHSAIHRIQPSVDISIKKYSNANHADLRMILNNWDRYAKGNFDFFKLFIPFRLPLLLRNLM